MKYIKLPIEKVVKFDAKGFAYPVCAVCGTDTLKVQTIESGSIILYCPKDNFVLRKMNNSELISDFAIYRYDMISHVEKQEKHLKKLFTGGFITYVNLLGLLKFGRKEIKGAL